jgi:hypothetical protein
MLRDVSRGRWLQRLGAVALGVAIVALLLSGRPVSTAAQEGGTVFAIDVDAATAGVQATRAPVAVGESVHIRAVLEAFGADEYGAYQVTVTFPVATLEWTGLPASWEDAPTADAGGNLLPFNSRPLCDPINVPQSLTPPLNGVGDAGVTMTCAEDDVDTVTTYTGDLVDMVFRCVAPGESTLTLSDVQDTYLLHVLRLSTPNAGVFGDVFRTATITCTGEALPVTPGSPTDGTALPGATTAPGTATGNGTQTPAPEGTESTPEVITGNSDDDDDDDDGAQWGLIAVIGVIAAVLIGGAAYYLLRGRATP